MFDRVKAGLAAFVRGVFPRMDYFARYSGTIVKQSGSNSFDFEPDAASVPGHAGIPVRLGVPGVTVQLNLGMKPRCLLGWVSGDPEKPFLDLWETPGLSSITVDPAANVNLGAASAAVGRVGDQVQVTLTSLEIATINSPSGPCSGGPITITGTITAGSPKVKA